MSGTAFGSDLSLTPSQEGLLRTTLSSSAAQGHHQKHSDGSLNHENSFTGAEQSDDGAMANGSDMYTSPTQKTPGSGGLGSFDESPFLDNYDNLDDGNFDWDNNGEELFGDLPGAEFNEFGDHHDKRKASTDEDGDEEGSSKRREGDDKAVKKTAQKPGRKPLTGEPTTKRKAQNRAAQRAFRERKERHLKDLETKVEDLEKASENANHENGRLRATVDKLQTELKEYRKRLSMNVSGAGYSPPPSATQSRGFNSGGNDFSFAFPKFGDLPGSYLNNGSLVKTTSPVQNGQRSASSSSPKLQNGLRKSSSSSANALSPTTLNGTAAPLNVTGSSKAPTDGLDNTGDDELRGLFSPSVLEYANRSNSTDYMSYPGSNAASMNGSAKKDSFGSVNGQSQVPNVHHASSASLTDSPASSMSHALDSSCGTTPESSAESPDNRKGSEPVLDTINEESKIQNSSGGKKSFCDEWAKACGSIANPVPPMLSESNGSSATSNLMGPPPVGGNGFDWMAQQNGGQFDPVLFGDYRDPQDNILNTFGDYFNDAFPLNNDFASPYNTGDVASQPPKKDFIKEIEVQRNGSPNEVVPGEDKKQFLTCDKLWDRVQTSQKAQSGEIDMDDLCSQLKSKAKCSGKGAVIDQKDVDAILGPAPAEPTNFLDMFS